MPPIMRKMSRTESPFEVATACSLTACFSSAFSFSPTVLVALGDAPLVAGLRYRAADIVRVWGDEMKLFV